MDLLLSMLQVFISLSSVEAYIIYVYKLFFSFFDCLCRMLNIVKERITFLIIILDFLYYTQVVEAVQAVKTTIARGEIKYPIKVVNMIVLIIFSERILFHAKRC